MIVLKNYKIILVLLFAFIQKGYNQTYTVKISYDASAADCHAAGFSWTLNGNSTKIASFSDGGNNMEVSESQTFTAVPNYSSFTLSVHSNCIPLGHAETSCNDSFNTTNTAVEMLQGKYLGLGGCNGGVDATVIPNVNIKNLDLQNPSTVCAGFQLSLAGFPAGFPNEAYHWQYSLNNQVTWTDVPPYIGANKTNDIATTTFSMQELLGNAHSNYLDKQVYFRLGYANKAWSTPIAITYSSCAPIAQYIKYEAPKCSGDKIQKIEVYFDRQLKSGEDLSIIYVLNEDPLKTTPRFQDPALVTSFTFDPPTNLYKYSFPNLNESLENENFYSVKYQARLNGSPMGTLKTTQQPFQYLDPVKMQFKITGQTQPTCFGAQDGTIDIEIVSGQEPYKFYVDNVLTTATQIDNLHYKINGLKASSTGYKIKVTDTNDCIEK